MEDWEELSKSLKGLEPSANAIRPRIRTMNIESVVQLSIAISLKRIADLLEAKK